jgi:prepilin-type N-terminal cleavage/methylation domain-containing protein
MDWLPQMRIHVMQNRQRGMSLLEILAAIAVGTILFIGLTDMIDVSLEDARGQQAAYHQAQVVAAAENYIAANYAALKADTDSGAVVAVTVPNLKTEGFLPGYFADQNSYQQNTCMLVRQDLSVGKLNALIVGYGGRAIPDRSIAAVAMGAGQGAGYITSLDTTTARGPSWSLETSPYHSGTCAGGVEPLTGGASDAGHLVSNIFYDGPGQLSTDFLYRDEVLGRPELNRMNVPLQMASAGLVDLGDSCTQTALALESTTKDVVVCDGGTWRYSTSFWKDPVASYGALATVAKKDGDVRVTRNTGRAFVYNGSSGTWNALAIDQNGDLDVPRHITGRTLHTTGHIYTDSDINVANNAYIGGGVDINGAVDIARNLDVGQTLIARGNIDARGNFDVRGNIVAQGNINANGHVHSATEVRAKWMATDTIVLDGWSTAGYGSRCHYPGVKADGTPVIINPIGTMLRDPNGILLNCINDGAGGGYFAYANGQITP